MADEDLGVLTEKEIKLRLKKFKGWEYNPKTHKISKEFVFKTFQEGINLIAKLAPFCDSIDHHPDIHISYKKVLFELQRFSVGGKVTDRDFIIASKIEELYSILS